MSFTMSDHHKAISRFISDSRDRVSELENQEKSLQKDLLKVQTELTLMRQITDNGQQFLNLHKPTGAGETAIVMPGNMNDRGQVVKRG